MEKTYAYKIENEGTEIYLKIENHWFDIGCYSDTNRDKKEIISRFKEWVKDADLTGLDDGEIDTWKDI